LPSASSAEIAGCGSGTDIVGRKSLGSFQLHQQVLGFLPVNGAAGVRHDCPASRFGRASKTVASEHKDRLNDFTVVQFLLNSMNVAWQTCCRSEIFPITFAHFLAPQTDGRLPNDEKDVFASAPMITAHRPRRIGSLGS